MTWLYQVPLSHLPSFSSPEKKHTYVQEHMLERFQLQDIAIALDDAEPAF